MSEFCKNKKHKTCCSEWGLLAILWALLFLVPGVLEFVWSVITNPIGGPVLTMVALSIVARKIRVLSWESERPFNDGDDSTPDLYRFNPGPGASWGIRAFMPDVEIYHFWSSPISWAVRQARRKVAILLDDGSVVFPWFPVAWISEKAGGGSRIPVGPGCVIPADIVRILQKRRDDLKKKFVPLTEYERDFLRFTSQIFKKDGPFVFEWAPANGGIEELETAKERAKFQETIEIIVKNQSVTLGKFGRRINDLERKSDGVQEIDSVVQGAIKSPKNKDAVTHSKPKKRK